MAMVDVSPAPCIVTSLVMVTGICMCEMKMLLHCERLSAHGKQAGEHGIDLIRDRARFRRVRCGVASAASCNGSLRFASDAYASPIPTIAATGLEAFMLALLESLKLGLRSGDERVEIGAHSRCIRRLHSLRWHASPRWLNALIRNEPTPYLSSFSFLPMTSALT